MENTSDTGAHGAAGTVPEAAGSDLSRRGHHRVTITLNKRPVRLDDDEATGLEIKQAAIEQGVAIELDFVLSLHLRGDGTRIIGDSDRIKVDERSRFTAVAGDDNS